MNKRDAVLFIMTSIASTTTLSSEQEVECLAQNIYHEARGQQDTGRLAVAHVTINRVQHTRFPNTVCAVVKQGRTKPSWKDGSPVPIKNKCQFSWYCDGKKDVVLEVGAWQEAMVFANQVYHNRVTGFAQSSKWDDNVQGAMWYHSTKVDPYWASSMQTVKQVDDHIFYKGKK
jgi:spore germination cell wall hydrolase CwlJ-like protein